MTRLLILVEGQSEEIFVKRTLTPHLAEHGVFVQSPTVLWTKRISSGGGFRGGVSNWSQIRKSLMPLTYDTDAWITTLIDFYGLPEDFPGQADINTLVDPREKVERLQEKLSEQINRPRLIPFLALHEFEAWLFCAPNTVADHFGNPAISAKITHAVNHAGEPEKINHGPTTHPKARLKDLATDYKETSDGPTLIQKIGIAAIRQACPHFDNWLQKLESLGNHA